MGKILMYAFLVSCLALLSGCETMPHQNLILTRFQDIKPDDMPPDYDVFGPGEVPSVYLCGYGSQTVTIEIFNISDGELIKKHTSYVPHGKDYYWMFSDLPPGSYKVILSIGGTSRDMKLFNIRR